MSASPENHEPGTSDRPRKKKRTLGTFPCAHCDKVFTRSDHLSRHNLNHEPKEVFKCDFVLVEYGGNKRVCGKTFVRKDLRERHAKRHLEFMDVKVPAIKQNAPRKSSISSMNSGDDSGPINPTPYGQNNYGSSTGMDYGPVTSTNPSAPNTTSAPNPQTLSINNLINDEKPKNDKPYVPLPSQIPPAQGVPVHNVPQNVPQNIPSSVPLDQNMQYQYLHPENLPFDYNKPMDFGAFIPQTQQDILSWLFTDSQRGSDKSSPNLVRHTPNPSPFESQLSPEIRQGPPQTSIDNFQPPQTRPDVPQFNGADGIGSTHNIGNFANNYGGLQDVNIFMNNDNPLDDVFSMNYRNDKNDPNSFNYSGLNTNLSLTSTTGSTNSPSTDSLTSRKASVVFSPDSIRASNNPEPLEAKLINHGIKYNVAKNQHFFVDSLIVDSFIQAIPDLTRDKLVKTFNHDGSGKFTIEDRLSYYLYMYWLVFHTQFSFLHKPSFSTNKAPPLLLLSMILIGCNYSSPTKGQELAKIGKRTPEMKFSLMVAVPLRYMIFQHEAFKSPVELWVLQSLVMLEWSEKNFLSRAMHERAHVHHGTTIQLLRRSPLLGGNPSKINKKNTSSASGSNTSAGEDDSDVSHDLAAASTNDTSDYDMFVKWVESESMKRITFMAFYMDIIDHIKFRHNPQITIYQLQLLNLPSDDELWNSREVNGSFKKLVKRQRKLQAQQQQNPTDNLRKRKDPTRIRNGASFLNVLKKLLKPSQTPDVTISPNLSVFTRKILLGGLVSIMYQLQQSDVHNSSSLLTSNGIIQSNNQRSKVWKEVLTRAFDNWNAEVIESYSSHTLSPTTSSIFNDIHTSRVPIPMYHLSQVIGMSDINHYDIAIFGGSPANQSVDATLKDHYVVQRKLSNMWLKNTHPSKRTINELINLRSVIHCYMLLWQLMLKPIVAEDMDVSIQYLDWNVNRDYFDSMYAVSIAMLVLWSYSFSIYGQESNRYSELAETLESSPSARSISSMTYEELVELSAEGGYQYLGRVRQEFLTNLRKDNLHKICNIHPFKFHDHPNDQGVNFSPHEIFSKYCDILPHITNKQNLSGLCFLVGTKLLSSQWEVIRENARLILNCGCRSIGKKEVICSDIFDGQLED